MRLISSNQPYVCQIRNYYLVAVVLTFRNMSKSTIRKKMNFTLMLLKVREDLTRHTVTLSRRCTGRVIDSPLEILANYHLAPLPVPSANT